MLASNCKLLYDVQYNYNFFVSSGVIKAACKNHGSFNRQQIMSNKVSETLSLYDSYIATQLDDIVARQNLLRAGTSITIHILKRKKL